VLLGFLAPRLDEPLDVPPPAAGERRPQPLLQPPERLLGARQQPAVEQRAHDRRIAARQRHRLSHAPHALPHLEPRVEEILQEPPRHVGRDDPHPLPRR
jgi:hypothetical protein